jgi:hypothetical protein
MLLFTTENVLRLRGNKTDQIWDGVLNLGRELEIFSPYPEPIGNSTKYWQLLGFFSIFWGVASTVASLCFTVFRCSILGVFKFWNRFRTGLGV